jgi:hypothetical protein
VWGGEVGRGSGSKGGTLRKVGRYQLYSLVGLHYLFRRKLQK